MTTGIRALLVATAAIVVVLTSSARAEDIIPLPEGGPVVTDLTLVGSKYELRDAENGRLLMQERNALPRVSVIDSRVTYTTQVNEQPTGYDLIVTFSNPTSLTLPIGTIYVGMVTLGADIEYLDVRHSSVWRAVNFNTFVGKGYTYPDDLYSPIYTLRSSGYAFSASLRYSAVADNHDVRVAIMNPTGSNSGEQGPGWGAGFRLSNPVNVPPSQVINHPASLPPNSSRTYVVCVRVARDRDDWMQTLLPYRTWFRSLYGGISYERSCKPILPVGIADSFYQEPGNLDGYGDPSERRPDVFGWGPWADRLVATEGYESVMLWAPSGLYFYNPQYNFPFQIASRWNSSPLLSTAFDPGVGLPRVKAAGTTLGLWWGRSLDVSPTWDSPTVTPLDPSNPAHVALAEAEITGAQRAGVDLLGLDTCNPSINGIRNAYLWIRHIRDTFPKMRFIAEPSPCDILNSQVGGVLPGWALDGGVPTKLSDCYPFQNPHYLADFLLPGHESIMSYRYNFHEDFFNHTPTDAEIDADVRWFASLGYIPMVWKEVRTVGDVCAAKSWLWTVPGKLWLEVDDAHFNTTDQDSHDVGQDSNSQGERDGGDKSGGEIFGHDK